MPFDITSLVAATTQEDRDAAAAALAKSSDAGSIKENVKQLADVVADKAKAKGDCRAAALCGLRALLSADSLAAEPYLIPMLPQIIEAMADKAKPACIEASALALALCESISPNAVGMALPSILAEAGGKWQSNLGRVQMMSALAKRCPVQMALNLTEIIPVMSDLMGETKIQVKDEAGEAMTTVFTCMTNKDLSRFLPDVILTIKDPELVPDTVHKLAGVVFVSEIFAPALSVMAPLLRRAMDAPATAIKRNCARIIENMSKLVDDPYEVEPFLDLLPKLASAKEEISDPECRDVCEKAYAQLKHTIEQPPLWKRIEFDLVLEETKAAFKGMKMSDEKMSFLAKLAHSLLKLKNVKDASWQDTFSQHGVAAASVSALLEKMASLVKVEEEKEEADDAEQLCDCQFSLAYGNKVLLNQTVLKLKRGYRYGLCGKNDSGKTSLMKAIADQQVEGFPPKSELRTMYVETDVQGEVDPGNPEDERLLSELSVWDFVTKHAGLNEYGVTDEMCHEMLVSVGFALDDTTMAPASLTKQVGRLSGGWRMKLALCRAMLMKADILLLDEPTNHLDPGNVQWVLNYLTSLTNVTSIIVSHDIKVLDQVCTHVLQIDRLKLKMYKGNLTYVATNHVPDLLSYFELKATKFHMKFPTPGMLEGVTSKGKHIMKMTNITFTYPAAVKAQLTGVTVRVSLGTRAACIGANGAGKSTMIKLLTGELQADKGSGEVWKHPNCRVAYVAQHAFHHIENHLEMTPNEYIRWRYEHGADKEGIEKITMKLSPEEEAQMLKPFAFEFKDDQGIIKTMKAVLKRFTDGRRTIPKSKEYEYEVLWQNDFKSYVAKEKLVKAGFGKLLKQVDERIAARATQAVRPLTQKFVEAHLQDVGLEPEFATHSRMGALSGGQKVKVVLAAAMWNTPHIVILDEPTNYLDRDSLGAMAEAINEYAGGIVIISHNAQFVDQVCPEVWHLENHTLNLKGSYDWLEAANKEAMRLAEAVDEYVDGSGNSVKVEKAKKPASKAELKKIKKKIAEKRKSGIEVFTDDELEEAGFLIEGM